MFERVASIINHRLVRRWLCRLLLPHKFREWQPGPGKRFRVCGRCYKTEWELPT